MASDQTFVRNHNSRGLATGMRWRAMTESAYGARVTTLLERAQGRFVGFLTALPPAVQRFLAGGRPVRIDGLELAAEYQLVLRLIALAAPRPLDTMTPTEARAEIRRAARVFAASPPAVARVEDRVLPGPAGPIAARLYVPLDDGVRRPLVVNYHGGGWVIGDLDTHDTASRHLAREANVGVLSIAYRLAPEHRFPAAQRNAASASSRGSRRPRRAPTERRARARLLQRGQREPGVAHGNGRGMSGAEGFARVARRASPGGAYEPSTRSRGEASAVASAAIAETLFAGWQPTAH